MKYRKKPVVIEAWPIEAGSMRVDAVPDWVQQAFATGAIEWSGEVLYVNAPEVDGAMVGYMGDMLIKGIRGELYPCNPDIFAATYEPVATAVCDDNFKPARDIA